MNQQDLQQLQERLTGYVAAETAILSGAQEYTVGQGSTARRVRRADLSEIRAEIASIRAQISLHTAGKRRGIFYLRPGN